MKSESLKKDFRKRHSELRFRMDFHHISHTRKLNGCSDSFTQLYIKQLFME